MDIKANIYKCNCLLGGGGRRWPEWSQEILESNHAREQQLQNCRVGSVTAQVSLQKATFGGFFKWSLYCSALPKSNTTPAKKKKKNQSTTLLAGSVFFTLAAYKWRSYQTAYRVLQAAAPAHPSEAIFKVNSIAGSISEIIKHSWGVFGISLVCVASSSGSNANDAGEWHLPVMSFRSTQYCQDGRSAETAAGS